jgi:hypothetical protein
MAARKLQDIELVRGRGYEVLRGARYANHDPDTCPQCLGHSHFGDPAAPKLHVVRVRDEFGEAYTFASPPIEVYLRPDVTYGFPEVRPAPLPAFLHRSARKSGFGDFWSDLWNFFVSVLASIVSFVVGLLKRIIYDLLHPLQLLKDLVQLTLDVITGNIFLQFLANFPLTRWLYLGIDHLTGGFLTNLTELTSLPGLFFTGQTITRAMAMQALGTLITVLSIAVAVVTGGVAVGLIGGSVTLLKQGPLGKTALGQTLLDIAGIGLIAVVGGTDLVEAFLNAGESKLQGTAIGALAQKCHLSSLVVALIGTGASEAESQISFTSSNEASAAASDEAQDEETQSSESEVNDEVDLSSVMPEPTEEAEGEETEEPTESETTSETAEPESEEPGEETGEEAGEEGTEETGEEAGEETSDETSEPSTADTESTEGQEGQEDQEDEAEEDEDEDESASEAAALKAALSLAKTIQTIETPAKAPAKPKAAAKPKAPAKAKPANSAKTVAAITAASAQDQVTSASAALTGESGLSATLASNPGILAAIAAGGIAILSITGNRR